MLHKIRNDLYSLLKKTKALLQRNPIVTAVVLSFAVTFVNETLNQRSLIKGIVFMFTRPVQFLCGVAIVMVLESLALLAKKRRFMMSFVSILWLVLGLTNFIIRCFRQTPFSFMDIRLLKSVFPILQVYLTSFGVIAAAVLIVAIIGLLVYLWIKSKKYEVHIKSSLITVAVSAGTCVGLIVLSKGVGIIPGHFSNLQTAYRDHGFNYCFVAGISDRGMSKPSNYDNDIHEVVSGLDDSRKDKDKPSDIDPPNVIFVQLESFYDLKLLSGFEFDRDPCPNFTKLKKDCKSGYLTVPSIGAGTANTEFEVLTGMSLKWFGAGEYPYETVMQNTTCESVCYNIANHGYTCHAVHNYRAAFYDRLNVFSRLGFDTFTPIEYMSGIKPGWKGWAQDELLTRYILSALDSTEMCDLVYCITVQCHGIYPTSEYVTEKHNVNIKSLPENANKYSFAYFADQLYETDRFIGELIKAVEDRGEDTVIVFFGDHIPNIGIDEEWIPSESTLYDTEYIVWSNCGIEGDDENMASYQLSSDVMSMIGYDDGVMTKLHQSRKSMDEELYVQYLELLQYDILYGEHIAYDGKIPFEQKDIKLGTEKIEITNVKVEGENCYVEGKNFTECSIVLINGSRSNTEFVSENKLMIKDIPKGDDIITVAQYGALLAYSRLGETEPYIYKQQVNIKNVR